MATIQIDDVNFYYELHGQGEPLVLIAGYTCDHTFWQEMLEKLTQHFQVLTFDNRGIGQTTAPDLPMTLEMMADDTMKLCAALELSQPHILGQSMGGCVAQIIGRKYASDIHKLIILNSVMRFNMRALMALRSFLDLLKSNVPFDTLVESCIPWVYSSQFLSHPKNIEALKDFFKENPFPQSPQQQERHLNAIEKFDSEAWIAEVKSQTLVIGAQEDILCLPTESAQLAKQIPNAQYIIIPGGHSSPMEIPDAVNHAILNFLIEHKAREIQYK